MLSAALYQELRSTLTQAPPLAPGASDPSAHLLSLHQDEELPMRE